MCGPIPAGLTVQGSNGVALPPTSLLNNASCPGAGQATPVAWAGQGRPQTSAIAGGVVAGLLGLGLLVGAVAVAVLVLARRRRRLHGSDPAFEKAVPPFKVSIKLWFPP